MSDESSEDGLVDSESADNDASGLPALVESSSSDDGDEASNDRSCLPKDDKSSENGLVNSESEDDQAVGAPAASKITRPRPLSG